MQRASKGCGVVSRDPRTGRSLPPTCLAGLPPAPATPPPLVIKASGKIAELERRAYEELRDRQVRWEGNVQRERVARGLAGVCEGWVGVRGRGGWSGGA